MQQEKSGYNVPAFSVVRFVKWVLVIVASFVVEGNIESSGFFFLRDAQANGRVNDFEQDEGYHAAIDDGDNDRY